MSFEEFIIYIKSLGFNRKDGLYYESGTGKERIHISRSSRYGFYFQYFRYNDERDAFDFHGAHSFSKVRKLLPKTFKLI